MTSILVPADYGFRTLSNLVEKWVPLEGTWYELGRKIVNRYAEMFFHRDIFYKIRLPVGPKILAANHPSTIDPFMMNILVPEQVNILINEVLFKIPIVGSSLHLAGQIRVEHQNGKPAMEQAIRDLKERRTVGIFPEGIISPIGGGLNPAHSGMARLALCTGAPVIPVGIGLDPRFLHPMETMVDGKPELGTWYFHGPYFMTIGEPMYFKGDDQDRALVSKVTEQIMVKVAALSEESTYRMAHSQQTGLRPFYPIRMAKAAYHL
jgi:1-acyl-sn-glycerol-3-phosphate acyltransferase